MILAEEGATSARLADVARQRINKTRDFSVLPQGKPSLSVLSNLERNAQQRSSGTYPQQSGVRRGEGGAGVPARSLDPVRIKPSERGSITSREINRRASERDANRNVPLTRKEVPVPIKSQPTSPSYRPTSRTKTPLTPQVRDQRAAAAGFSGQGSTPKGPKLYRQTMRGVSTGDDPMAVLRSAATPPKPTSKPKPVRGGSSSLPNVGRGVNVRPSGTGRFTPGTGGNFGISGIGLAN